MKKHIYCKLDVDIINVGMDNSVMTGSLNTFSGGTIYFDPNSAEGGNSGSACAKGNTMCVDEDD